MKLSNFNYKPRCITQITKMDFEECGFDFRQFISNVLYAKFPESKPLPKEIGTNIYFHAMEADNTHLGSFRFSFVYEEEYKENGITPVLSNGFRLKFMFPFKKDCYDDKAERNNDAIYGEKAFPASVESRGYAFGNFHIDAVIAELYEGCSRASISFDEEGNHLPVSYSYQRGRTMSMDTAYAALRYTPQSIYDPTDLDNMFIPELSNAPFGIYAFWLDRFHIAFIKDINKAGYHSNANSTRETVISVWTSSDYKEMQNNKQKLDDSAIPVEPYLQQRFHKYWRDTDDLSYSTEGMFILDTGNCSLHQATDLHTIRSLINPTLSKALEIFEIVNSDPEKFYKQTLFPESCKKIAEAISPLVSMTSQIIRSCKSFQMEEI